MSDTPDPEAVSQYWQEAIERMNDQFAEAMERNVDAGTEFVEAWLDAIEEASDDDVTAEAIDGYRRAYETWMEAAEETVERSTEAMEGEDVDAEEIRDTWLDAANQSFKEVMGTAAFAHLTGQTVEETLDLRQQAEEVSQESLREFGFATSGDVREVGERLVELERRQHAVEEKLDEVLDAVEDE